MWPPCWDCSFGCDAVQKKKESFSLSLSVSYSYLLCFLRITKDMPLEKIKTFERKSAGRYVLLSCIQFAFLLLFGCLFLSAFISHRRDFMVYECSSSFTHFLSRETFWERRSDRFTNTKEKPEKLGENLFHQSSFSPHALTQIYKSLVCTVWLYRGGQRTPLSPLHFTELSPLQTMLFVIITGLVSLWEW